MEKSELPTYWILGALIGNLSEPMTKEYLVNAYKDRMTERETLSTIENLVKNESIGIRDKLLYTKEKGKREYMSIVHNIKRENERHTLETDTYKLTIKTLNNSLKEFKYRTWYNLLFLVAGAVIAFFSSYILEKTKSNQEQSQQMQSKSLNVMHVDTIIVINKTK
jgi:hypothetical protein